LPPRGQRGDGPACRLRQAAQGDGVGAVCQLGRGRAAHDRLVRGEPRPLGRARRLADREDRRHRARVRFDRRGLVAAELAALALIVAAHVVLLTVLLHAGTTFDEGVYLLSLDALDHGQALGREVFTSQGPGFYVLLQAIGGVFGVTVAGVRLGIVTLDAIGAVFAFLLGRRIAGPLGGLGCAAMIAIAPKLGDFGGRVFADQCAMVLVVVALWLVAVRQPLPAGALLAAAVLVKLSALTALPTVVALLALERRRTRAF